MNKFITLLLISTLCIHCNTKPKTLISDEISGLITEKAMVVSAREEASKIGVEIMKQGGNAFDAMIATDLAAQSAEIESLSLFKGLQTLQSLEVLLHPRALLLQLAS